MEEHYWHALKLGVKPDDVIKYQLSIITGLIDKIKRKLKDLWDSGNGTVPIIGALLAAVAAPLYAVIALTN